MFVLSLRGKKILLSIHIMLVAVWLGSLLSILLIYATRHNSLLPADYHLADRFIFVLFDTVVVNVSVAVAVSGLLFALFTQWGFFKFHWINLKWLAIVGLAMVIMFLAGPAVNGMAALSDVFRGDGLRHVDYVYFAGQVLLYTLVQVGVILLVIVLSVFKPWGARKPKRQFKRRTVLISGLVIAVLLVLSMAMQYSQLYHFRHLPIGAVDLSQVEDGQYTGRADYGFDYEVRVQVNDHHIKSIEIVRNRDSFYARLAEGVTRKIIRAQKIDIDTVTGATTTSKVLIKAVENALAGPPAP